MSQTKSMFCFGLMLAILLVGCDQPLGVEKYGLTASADGSVYRLNAETGEIHKIHGSQLVLISETNRIEMTLGDIYVFEDGRQMEYVGAGEFRPFTDNTVTLQEYLNSVKEN
jgi:hypothetical protein